MREAYPLGEGHILLRSTHSKFAGQWGACDKFRFPIWW